MKREEHVTLIQELLEQLRSKGWTLSAVADELGIARRTLSDWQAGTHYPTNTKLVEEKLTQLLQRKRIPKQKRYGAQARGRPVQQK
jgi:hypothetical protein